MVAGFQFVASRGDEQRTRDQYGRGHQKGFAHGFL
jgi:hypothetical protein